MRTFLACMLFAASIPTTAQIATREDRWRADVDALYQRITTAHPNPYTKTTAETYEQEYRSLLARIASSSDQELMLGLSRLAALANDSHTEFDFTQTGAGMRRYSITYKWFSDGLYVTAAPFGFERLIGKRVVSLAGKPIEEVYEALRPWISHDTETWYRYKSQAAFPIYDLLVAAGVVRGSSLLAIEAVNEAGERTSAGLPVGGFEQVQGPVFPTPNPPLYKRHLTQPYWFTWIEESRTLYVQYNRCVESALLPMQQFAGIVVEAGRLNPPDRIVFDIRENSGGSTRWFAILTGTLANAYLSGVIAAPRHGAFGIISKKTFSSGSVAASNLKEAGIRLVGETIGGRVAWFGETTPLILPGSQLAAFVSTRLFETSGFAGAIEPDFPVEFKAADYFADRDPYLEAVLQMSTPAGQPTLFTPFRAR